MKNDLLRKLSLGALNIISEGIELVEYIIDDLPSNTSSIDNVQIHDKALSSEEIEGICKSEDISLNSIKESIPVTINIKHQKIKDNKRVIDLPDSYPMRHFKGGEYRVSTELIFPKPDNVDIRDGMFITTQNTTEEHPATIMWYNGKFYHITGDRNIYVLYWKHNIIKVEVGGNYRNNVYIRTAQNFFETVEPAVVFKRFDLRD